MPSDAHTMLTRSRELRKHMTREEKHLYYDGLKKLPWNWWALRKRLCSCRVKASG